MTSQPFYRLLFAGGILVALLGVYGVTRTSPEIRWNSIAFTVVIGIGVMMALIGLVQVLGSGEPEPEELARRRSVLPASMLPIVFGGFLGAIALIAGLAVGHYEGRNAGFITFIAAFLIANGIFGIGLAAAAKPSVR